MTQKHVEPGAAAEPPVCRSARTLCRSAAAAVRYCQKTGRHSTVHGFLHRKIESFLSSCKRTLGESSVVRASTQEAFPGSSPSACRLSLWSCRPVRLPRRALISRHVLSIVSSTDTDQLRQCGNQLLIPEAVSSMGIHSSADEIRG